MNLSLNRHRPLIILALAILLPSCVKYSAQEAEDREVVIRLEDGFDVETKTTAVTSIPSTLYWGATTGGNADGSSDETVKWGGAANAAMSTSVSSNQIHTGHYVRQILDAAPQQLAETYNFYVSNTAFTVGSASTMTVANNGTDIIVGRGRSSSATPAVTLNHIFSRIRTVRVNCNANYTLTGVSITMTPKTSGTYNLRTLSWSSSSAGSATTLLSAATISSGSYSSQSNDIYLVPGTYTVTANYTETRGDFTRTVSKSASITLAANGAYNITVSFGEGATEVVFTSEVTAWGSNEITLNLPPVPSFDGLQIAPGPLMYENGGFTFANDWSVNSYNSAYSLNEGSTYFSFIEMGQLFEKADFSASDGDIENLLDPFDGWRLPTRLEFQSFIGTTRPGATVNGTPNVHFAMVWTSESYAGSLYNTCLLLFPDNASISGAALSGYDALKSSVGSLSVSDIEEYVDQGCVCLPSTGYAYGSGNYYDRGNTGYYYSSNQYGASYGYYLMVYRSNLKLAASDKTDYCPICLVKEIQ